jgi:osmotically inducible protein OsmC
MKRNASAEWKGGLKDGKGTISSDSGVLTNTQYSFSTRFEDGKGTNPEELIAAAHAGASRWPLSAQLGTMGSDAGQHPHLGQRVARQGGDGFAITAVHLVVKASVPGADAAQFATAANNAKAGCPGLQGAEGHHHDGRDARGLNAPDGHKACLGKHLSLRRNGFSG